MTNGSFVNKPNLSDASVNVNSILRE